jgi:hypothetical protein
MATHFGLSSKHQSTVLSWFQSALLLEKLILLYPVFIPRKQQYGKGFPLMPGADDLDCGETSKGGVAVRVTAPLCRHLWRGSIAP